MKKILLLLLLLAGFAQAQKPVSTIRGEVNTKLPTNGANQIQAVKVREIFSDVLDHIDTTNKRMYGKTIAQIRLINNTKYEIVFVLNSGKQGWFYYDSADTSTSDDNQNTIVAANGRRYKRSVLLENVTSVNGQTGVVTLSISDLLGDIETVNIADGAVTLPKVQSITTQRLLGRDSAGTGQVHQLTLSQVMNWLSTSRGAIPYRGVSNWSALAPGTAGYVLTTGGAGADPYWADVSIANNSISNAKFRQSAGLSVVGNATNATANVADITASNDGEVLRRNGTAIGFGTIATAGITNNAVTFPKLVNISNGGWLARISASTGNVEEITTAQARTQLSINNTDNTSDANKPVSTATQTALNGKQVNIQFKDEGANSGTAGAITEINFVGPGVTMTNSGTVNTVTIPGGGAPFMGVGSTLSNSTSGDIVSQSIAGGSFSTVRPVKVRIFGRYLNNTGSPQNITVSPYLGGTPLPSSALLFSPVSDASSGSFRMEIYFNLQSNTSVSGGMIMTIKPALAASSTTTQIGNFDATTVPTLASTRSFVITAGLGTASANLTITVDRYIIEY